MRKLRHLWRNFFRRRQVEADIDAELRATLDLIADEGGAAGFRPDLIKERIFDVKAGAFLQTWMQDARYGARLLRRQPLFTAAAVLSLGVGIGASTTIFSLVNALLLRSVGVEDPAALVELGRIVPPYGRGTAFSYPAYERFRDENHVLAGVLTMAKNTMPGTAGPDAVPAEGRYVSGNFFDVLGVRASSGRTFSPAEDRIDAPADAAVAVLSHRLWRRAFAGSDSALGETIRIDAVAFTVIGVASPAFDDLVPGRSADFFVPIASEPLLRRNSQLRSASSAWLAVVGRLKPGVSEEAARAGLEPAFARFVMEDASDVTDPDIRRQILAQHVFVQSARNGISDIRRDVARPIVLLMGAVSLVLLIACVNVVNLLLARGVTRRRELAMRLAIGAGRGRLVRQLLTESLLLGAAGAGCGLAVAIVAAPAVLSLVTQAGTPLQLDVSPDRGILLFTIAVGFLSSLIAGTLPAVRTARVDLAPSLHDDARTLRVTRESARWRNALIAAQVALSVVLLSGATLLVATLRNIHAFNPGFDASHVVLLDVFAGNSGYDGGRLAQYYRDVLAAARAIPGAQAAALSKVTPISGGGIDRPVTIDARPRERDAMVNVNAMSESYFSTLSIPLLLGRDFAPSDGARQAGAAIVNEAFARRFFGGVNPIGHRVTLANDGPREIVGLVANSKYTTLRERDTATVYVYMAGRDPGMTLSIRTAIAPLALGPTLRERVQSIAASVRVSEPRTLTFQVDRSLASERLIARLLSGFAVLALVLAAVGLYGTLGYTVARRTAEIGLRLALGATRGEVLRSVLRQSLTVVATGLAVGMPATLLLSKPIAGMLYGVAPSDPRVLAGSAACLLLVAAAASAVPALRAARVDPLVALRHE